MQLLQNVFSHRIVCASILNYNESSKVLYYSTTFCLSLNPHRFFNRVYTLRSMLTVMKLDDKWRKDFYSFLTHWRSQIQEFESIEDNLMMTRSAFVSLLPQSGRGGRGPGFRSFGRCNNQRGGDRWAGEQGTFTT